MKSILRMTALWLAVLLARPSVAEATWRHPELERATDALDAARGPETYTELRRIWGAWNEANPLQVEQALVAASENRSLDPFAREYAAILVAYARQRRGDLTTSRRMIQSLGFVDDWMIVGPFDNEGKAGLKQVFEPELALQKAIVPGRAYEGKERPVRWRKVPKAFPYGWVDLSSLLRPESKLCAYLTTFVQSEEAATKARPVTIWLGVGGAFRLFWNGEEKLSDDAYRAHDVDRQAVSVWLKPGYNRLTLKVCGDESAPQLSVRLRDGRGFGNARVRYAASAETSAAAQVETAAARDDVARPLTRVNGPLQRFEELIRTDERPTTLEAFARYLVETHSDDEVRHQARDLAIRAANQDPTLERLLLAARLAEDQNARSRWLDRATALLGRAAEQQPELMLARARVLRRSPRWRESLELYRRARALDPDGFEAAEGLVALYNQVGLPRTALSELQSALGRNPHSVGLLNLYASQLRKLGRSVEATEAEHRYAAYRFDDRGFLASQAELAATRRDGSLAQHWLKRLLDVSPDSLWALGLTSRIQRSLGEDDRAVAALERALTLAPEDVGVLRSLADLKGELGERDEQLRLLQRLLAIRPQERDVREYVEYLKPATARGDEAYAWKPARFLIERSAPANGYNQRTLRDLTVTTVYKNGLSSHFRQIVFQPLTDTAAALARQYAFQYQADRQVVQLRGAKVFRGDGRIDEAIEYGEGAANDPDISMYTSARTFYVQFPRLDPGDVVELRYRIDDIGHQNVFADYFGEVVYLQSNEPVSNAEYVLITPSSLSINVDVHSPNVKRKHETQGSNNIAIFFAKDTPAIQPEPTMPPWPEVLGFIHASTYKSWQDLGKWYWGLIKDQFELDSETKQLAHDLAKDAKSELEKVQAVYGWVVKNTRYVALEFGIYGYKPRRCVQTVARGWGDCKDKATVIVALLGELGIDSTPVLLRSQMRGGFPSRIPSLEAFDHVIVYIPSLDLYLDGTAEFTGSRELPEMDQGALGLKVNRGKSELVELPLTSREPNLIRRTIEAQLRKSGGASLVLEYEVRGSAAPSWRRRYGAESTRRERVVEMLADDWPGFSLSPGNTGLKVGELDDIEQPVTMTARGSAESFAHREGGALSLEVTPSVRMTSTFASLSTRHQSVRLLGMPQIEDLFTIQLPAGSKVRDQPRSAAGQSEFGQFSVEVSQSGNSVSIVSRLKLSQAYVPPAKYTKFREFCAAVDKAFNQRLLVE